MKKLHNAVIAGISLTLLGASAQAGILSLQTYTTDQGTGVSPTMLYTHAIDFNGAGGTTGKAAAPNINGVQFTNGAAGDQTATLKYNLAGPSTSFTNNNDAGTPAASGIHSLLADFFYGTQTETLTLTGLQPSTAYTARFFVSTAFAGNTFTFSASDTAAPDGTSLTTLSGLNRGAPSSAAAAEYVYRYTTAASGAASNSVAFTFTSADTGNTFHQYGFSNETVPEPTSLAFLGVGSLGLLARRRKQV